MNHYPAHPESEGPGREPRAPRTDRCADALINRILDAESEGELHAARELTAHGEAIFPGFAARMERTRDALGRLAVLPETPDFTRAILAKVALSPANPHHSTSDESHSRDDDELLAPAGETQLWQRHLGRSERTFSATRLAMAAGVAGAVAFAMVLNRYAPVRPAPGVGPVEEVVAASRADLADTTRSLAGAIFSLGDDLLAPLPPTRTPPRPKSLRLGDASKYEAPLGASAVASMLVSTPTRMLAIVDGPVRPRSRWWEADEPPVGVASVFPGLPLAGESAPDGPQVHAWKLLPAGPDGAMSITRQNLSWAELDARARPAGDGAGPAVPK